MAAKALPSQEVLRQLLDYDPETGALTWRSRADGFFPVTRYRTRAELAHRWNVIYAGKPALQTFTNGYLGGRLFTENVRAHRVAWKIFHGTDPQGQIDHINGDKLDNRIANLRVVDAGGNARNRPLRSDNKSGVNGVFAHSGKWRAGIRFNGRYTYLGTFETFSDAVSSRRAAELALGFHANHGREVAG